MRNVQFTEVVSAIVAHRAFSRALSKAGVPKADHAKAREWCLGTVAVCSPDVVRLVEDPSASEDARRNALLERYLEHVRATSAALAFYGTADSGAGLSTLLGHPKRHASAAGQNVEVPTTPGDGVASGAVAGHKETRTAVGSNTTQSEEKEEKGDRNEMLLDRQNSFSATRKRESESWGGG